MSAGNNSTDLCTCISSIGKINIDTKIYKDECMLCFDHVKSKNGVFVCLSCFWGSCKGALNHTYEHFQRKGHSIFLNIKRVRIEKPLEKDNNDGKSKITKVAIGGEGGASLDDEAGNWEDKLSVCCLKCNLEGLKYETNAELKSVVEGVLKADSASTQASVKSWEHKITECEHTLLLEQDPKAPKLAAKSLAHCGECKLSSNLWLCMTCGHLGCGRKNFDGSGGNNHGVNHWETTKHPLVCKMGTVTAEGTADIFCYACDDAKKDPKLEKHFAHFGIDLSAQEKTEKSTGELELEQNLKLKFKSIADDYLSDPCFGPGYTGLINVGNSCYLASVIQNLFSISDFQKYFLPNSSKHQSQCNKNPANCWHCQSAKLVDGLFSGRYSKKIEEKYQHHEQIVKNNDDGSKTESMKVTEKTRFVQEAIAPRMFKQIAANENAEFLGMSQQDAYEYYQHLISFIQDKERQDSFVDFKEADPTHALSFKIRQRLQCTECKRVRYKSVDQCELSLRIPVNKADPPLTEASSDEKRDDLIAREKKSVVSVFDCFDSYFATEAIEGFDCPQCKKKTIATKSNALESTPKVLVTSVVRQVLDNWVPRKLHLSIGVPSNPISLHHLLAKKPSDDEQKLPEPEAKYDIDENALNMLMAAQIPKIRAQRAILATNNTGADAAMNWLFQHLDDADIDDPLPPPGQSSSDQSNNSGGVNNELVANLQVMIGDTVPRITKALRLNSNNPDNAVNWLFSNPDDPGDVEDLSKKKPSELPKYPIDDRLPIYQLTGLIEHRGASVHSGHYVAYLYKNGKWIQFNDSSVHISEKPPTDQSYMYFWTKVDETKNIATASNNNNNNNNNSNNAASSSN